ncbi:STAS/SEC14 domain-containing protein [Hymenobacter koreensis]|uniref:STAS/SEC14 domain-containing protein n=1 Tax=Hymenobacter koreensis TaxID=1084523 RepID=A0ABP8JHX5_9BACT
MILYENAHLRILYDGRLRLLEAHWLGPASSDEFRRSQTHLLDLAERYQARAWLGDLRRLPGILPLDQIWLEQNWFPRFLKLGLEKLAIVNADDPFSRADVAAVAEAAKAPQHPGRPDVRYFNDVSEAREWVSTPLSVARLPRLG